MGFFQVGGYDSQNKRIQPRDFDLHVARDLHATLMDKGRSSGDAKRVVDEVREVYRESLQPNDMTGIAGIGKKEFDSGIDYLHKNKDRHGVHQEDIDVVKEVMGKHF